MQISMQCSRFTLLCNKPAQLWDCVLITLSWGSMWLVQCNTFSGDLVTQSCIQYCLVHAGFEFQTVFLKAKSPPCLSQPYSQKILEIRCWINNLLARVYLKTVLLSPRVESRYAFTYFYALCIQLDRYNTIKKVGHSIASWLPRIPWLVTMQQKSLGFI